MPYAEVVFSPGTTPGDSRTTGTDPIEAVLDGLAAGGGTTASSSSCVPTSCATTAWYDAQLTLEVALRYAGRGVVALNCAGSERTGVEQFAWLFRKAARAGLRSVPHAGEWAGPENVRATLEHLRPDRIGHGVRAIEDPALVAELADRRIPLICPVSNVATGVYDDVASVPLPALRDAGSW